LVIWNNLTYVSVFRSYKDIHLFIETEILILTYIVFKAYISITINNNDIQQKVFSPDLNCE